MPRFPNILCRVSNIKPQFVQKYVSWLPKEKTTLEDFYNNSSLKFEYMATRP